MVIAPAVDVLDLGARDEMQHDPVEGDFRHAVQHRRIGGGRVEILAGDDADLRQFGQDRGVRGRRRIGLQQVRASSREIVDAAERVDLLAHRRLHVDRRIDLASRRGLVLAIGA